MKLVLGGHEACYACFMTPPLDRLAAMPSAGSEPRFPGTDPEVLRAATARMNALGIDGDVVHATNDPAEMRAYIESLPVLVGGTPTPPVCAPTS